MNETPFKSWVIANFETLANILIIAIWITGGLIQVSSQGINADAVVAYWMLQFFIILVIGGILYETFAIGFMADLFRLLISIGVVAFFIFCVYTDDIVRNLYYYPLLIAALIAMTVGGLTAILCSRYAYGNFEDVASRRMRYHNSNVDLFDIRWKYAFNRFVAIFCYFIIFIPLMTLLWSVDWAVFLAE